MCFVELRGIELKLDRVVGKVCGRLFEMTPPKVKGQPEVKLRNALWPPHLMGRTLSEVLYIPGVEVHEGSAGSSRGQIARELPMTTKFGKKNP